MEYLYVIVEGLSDYAKKSTWNLLRAYIDAHSQILFDEHPGDGVQAISRLQYKCANMTFAEQIRYNRLFQKVIYKVGESAISYIKIFQKDKDLVISVINSYSEYQLMHTLLYNFRKGGK